MSLVERDTQNLRQLRIDGEAEIAQLEARIASARVKLTAIGEIEQDLTTALPVDFIAIIDLRNEVPVFDTIKKTVEELRKSARVKSIKVVCSPTTFLKYETEFGALAFVRDVAMEFLYGSSFVLDHHSAR